MHVVFKDMFPSVSLALFIDGSIKGKGGGGVGLTSLLICPEEVFLHSIPSPEY